jgi:hypothetical protein
MNTVYLRLLTYFISASFLAVRSIASELDTFSLKDLQGTKGFVTTSGVMYSLPRTRLQVQIPLAMQRTVVTRTAPSPTPSAPADGAKSNTFTSYRVILDPTKQVQITSVFEDDPNLSFFLTCKDSWLVDATGGSIKFADNSTRLTHVGVTYQDQTIKMITAAVGVIGQLAGTIVHAALLNKDITDQGNVVTKTDIISGAAVTAQKDLSLNEATWNHNNDKDYREFDLGPVLDQAQERLVALANEQLKSGNDEPVTDKNLPTRLKLAKVRITTKVVLDVKAYDMVRWLAGSVDKEHFDGGRLPRVPGILYREPGPTDLQLELDEPYGTLPFHLRLPEAGIFGWVRISSEVFKTTGPSLDFSPDGGVSVFGFTSTSQVQDMLTSVNTLNTAAKALIDSAKTDLDKQRQAAATLELQKMKIVNDIVVKKRDIELLRQKLLTEQDESKKQELRNQINQAEYELAVLKKRLEYLDQGINVPAET